MLILPLTPALYLNSGPVPVLVMSLVFILCVFLLHIWGKLRRDIGS